VWLSQHADAKLEKLEISGDPIHEGKVRRLERLWGLVMERLF
jgi:hypothetical protein